MAFETLKTTLEKNGFTVSVFETKQQAADYLDKNIDQTTVGMGGSMTIKELGLIERLSTHNALYYHALSDNPRQTMREAMQSDVYLLSANAIAQDTGQILNMDGTGNRVASSLFGHRKVYILAGKNKVSENFEKAYWRLRNVVAPKNAQRLGKKTPCAKAGDRCYDCNSPERICNALVVHDKKVGSMEMEIVLINEDLGY